MDKTQLVGMLREWAPAVKIGAAFSRAQVCRHMLDAADLIEKLERELGQSRKRAAKLLFDTGKGCSVCGGLPVVNVEGTYWLCGPCVSERINEPGL